MHAEWTHEERRIGVPAPAGQRAVRIDYYRNSLGMEFVPIPPGEFAMGRPHPDPSYPEEGPAHSVTITKGFYMGAHEVTQEQYAAVMDRDPSKFPGPDRPVEQVSWHDAVEFCARLSRKEGRVYRLPTEAEWEYACRAGMPGDSTQEPAEDRALSGWHSENSYGKTHNVGLQQPNDWGLYDVHGNVWEWCQDLYGEDYYGLSPEWDPQGPTSGIKRVLRGGSWDRSLSDCRPQRRHCNAPVVRNCRYGFRVACEPTEPER